MAKSKKEEWKILAAIIIQLPILIPVLLFDKWSVYRKSNDKKQGL